MSITWMAPINSTDLFFEKMVVCGQFRGDPMAYDSITMNFGLWDGLCVSLVPIQEHYPSTKHQKWDCWLYEPVCNWSKRKKYFSKFLNCTYSFPSIGQRLFLCISMNSYYLMLSWLHCWYLLLDRNYWEQNKAVLPFRSLHSDNQFICFLWEEQLLFRIIIKCC